MTELMKRTINTASTDKIKLGQPENTAFKDWPTGWAITFTDPLDKLDWYKLSKESRNTITKIKEIVPNKVYEYIFGNGDVQKTVCSKGDQFSMEDSITIAYAKHFMGGSGKYNRAVDKAMKMFKNQKDAEEKAKKEKEDAEARRAKKAKKRAERLARKREAELEEKIAIQAEAYRRAMESMKKDGTDE